jgi:signal transduction histidine kinase
MAPEQLGELVRRAVKLVQHKADLQSIEISVDIAEDVPEVVCDGNQIEQACLAVIMNAIEAMHDGGELRVRVLRYGEEQVEIAVEDTGGGIPEEIRMKIFEPFFSTKAEGQGTGLGLSVMYGIVQRHGGQVKVESEMGRGTKMRIVLPLSAVEATVGGPDSRGD